MKPLPISSAYVGWRKYLLFADVLRSSSQRRRNRLQYIPQECIRLLYYFLYDKEKNLYNSYHIDISQNPFHSQLQTCHNWYADADFFCLRWLQINLWNYHHIYWVYLHIGCSRESTKLEYRLIGTSHIRFSKFK